MKTGLDGLSGAEFVLNATRSFGLSKCQWKIWINFKEKKMVNYDWYLDQGFDEGISNLDSSDILKIAEKYDLTNKSDIVQFALEVIDEFREINE